MKTNGLLVKSVLRGSDAFFLGLKKQDRIVAVDDVPVDDELDFMFYSAASEIPIRYLRDGKTHSTVLNRTSGTATGIEFVSTPIRRCTNKCIFCFIDQMPRGLRKELYVKDEDWYYSFLHGNYVTLSGVTPADLQKIATLAISPLYISVHATRPSVRSQLLGRKNLADIRPQLAFLARSGIRFHTQIVVCPGINDGGILAETVNHLLQYDQSLLSIAVVPVGLTKFHFNGLQLIDAAGSQKICLDIGEISDRSKKQSGIRKVFVADELFLNAGKGIPPRSYYEDYPQIENGVGLVRQFLDEWKNVQRRLQTVPKVLFKRRIRVLVITGCAAYPSVSKVFSQLEEMLLKVSITVLPVTNTFFGEKVTVTGLLTARDICYSVKKQAAHVSVDFVIVPSVIFNYKGNTIDGKSCAQLARQAGLPVFSIDNIKESVDCIQTQGNK